MRSAAVNEKEKMSEFSPMRTLVQGPAVLWWDGALMITFNSINFYHMLTTKFLD